MSNLVSFFKLLGTDWRMWLLFMLAVIIIVTAAKWVFRISCWILR